MNKLPIIDFDYYLQKKLKNKEFKRLFDEHGRRLELSYGLLQMRKHKKMSQATLAKKIGSTQSNVARMEAGNQNFSLHTLEKIARAFDKRLDIQFK